MAEQGRRAGCVQLELELAVHTAIRRHEVVGALGLIGFASPCDYLLATGSRCPFQGRIDAAPEQTKSGIQINIYQQSGQLLDRPCPDEEKVYGTGLTEAAYKDLWAERIALGNSDNPKEA